MTAPADRVAADRLDTGRRMLVVRHRSASVRLEFRVLVVGLVLAAVAAVVAALSLSTGDFPVPLPEVLRALVGEASSQVHLVVVGWRLPRVLMALLLGGALGMSGAIFQSLTRNPLGSPDIIGFNTGAYTGALVVIILAGGGYLEVAAGALGGGLITAAIVYLLAYSRGVQGFRLIIVGIAISAMLGSVNTWLILRADLQVAMSAAVWGAGSLNGIGWQQAWPATVCTVVLGAVALVGARAGRLLEMGDDTAVALGVRAQRSRLIMTVLGVALTASVTAVAGPIGFIALAAPQLARRLTRTAGVSLGASALMGAALLVVSDWLAQHAIPGVALPVGVVTVSVGGLYFIWLLISEARR